MHGPVKGENIRFETSTHVFVLFPLRREVQTFFFPRGLSVSFFIRLADVRVIRLCKLISTQFSNNGISYSILALEMGACEKCLWRPVVGCTT